MKVLFCNKYNFPFSGTEAYIFQAMQLLRSKGYEPALFSMSDSRGDATPFDRHFMPHADFKAKAGWLQKSKLAARALYSIEARRKLRALIAEFRPDVAHVRNIYHHLSPSILWELKAQSIPVLYHLNDFKVLCPSYNLVSNGKACEACKGGRFWRAIPEGCYPGAANRVALVLEAYAHQLVGTYRRCVDRFLAPSEFVRDKFVDHGWDPEKFDVLPHFQTVNEQNTVSLRDGTLLYFGRLSKEKGVDDLIRAMASLPAFRLKIAGDGPEREPLEKLACDLRLTNIDFLGFVQKPKLASLIASSSFTVLPSHAYETFGKTILESFSHGRAVVASDLGSRRELIQDGKSGVLYKTGDVAQLASAIDFLSRRPDLADGMGRAGREQLQGRYTADSHYWALIEIYGKMLRSKPLPVRKTQLPSNGSPAQAPPQSAQPKAKVAFIGGRGVISKYSGIETYYEEVGRRLADQGYEITAYCRNYFTPPQQKHSGMKLVRLPTIRAKHLETVLHTLLSTLHVSAHPCDVVHYHALGPALFSFIPRLFGRKTVVTVQGLDWQRKKWGRMASTVLRLGEQAAVAFPDATMVVSRTLQDYYWQNHKAATSYVPNGGLLRDLAQPKKIFEWGLEPHNYILFLGRLSPEKGCHLLVEAYERILPSAKLVLAGASSYCDEYSNELRTHAGENIKILDWVSGPDLDELLTNAMIFVLPSDLEGLSLALLDAMGAGLCVLASDVSENREAMEGAGFTFQRGNAFDLADRLLFLLANPAAREAAGKSAKRRVRDDYQWSDVAFGVERIYRQVLNRSEHDVSPKKPSARVPDPRSQTRQRRTG